MTARTLLLAGSAALLAVPGHAVVGDFRLPPGDTPTPSPTVVGPVDPESPAPRPSPTPTATVAPMATPTPVPVLTLPSATPSSRATPTERPTSAARTPAPATAPVAADATPTPQPTAATTMPPTFAPPSPGASAEPVADEPDGLAWGWIAGFGLLVALLAGGWWWLRRRMIPGGTVLTVPEIEKPRIPDPQPEAPPQAAPEMPAAKPAAAPAAHPLHIAVAPLKLTQTVMNATLSYRLTLTNQGEAPLENLTVAADLVAAHASLPREALMAAPDTELPERHAVLSLAPGESAELKGEVRLPLAQAMPIRQGQAVVFVPLARFRASAGGTEPRCFTLVVGEPSPRGAIQPIRLDLGPRSTEGLAGRAF